MTSISKTIFAAALAFAPAGMAAAQDVEAEPTYETINLRSGFSPDPRVVSLRAGGDIAADTIRRDCHGYIADAPDVQLDYEAGHFPLIISAGSLSDTTLVIHAPDGSFHCNDDGGEGSNPAVRFREPQSGTYRIWVGTFLEGPTRASRLHISEVGSQ